MDTMNTGQYQNRPQISGLLADDFQYDEYDGDLESSNQASHPMFPWFDGLPRTPSQHFMNNTSSSANILSSNYNSLLQPIPMSQASIPWEDPNQSSGGFQDNNTTSFYGYSASNIPVNGHNGSFLQGSTYQQQVPRFMPNMFGMNDNNISLEESYAPSSYLLDSARNGLQHSPTRDSPFENQHLSNARDLQRMSISNSPIPKMEQEDSRLDFSSFERPPPFGLPSSETSDEGNSSREMTAVEAEDQDEINEPSPDEPYAKLIHRALMSAPTKSMVLQEIYQWFRDNTQKGGAESKGWMNSIRHNLSMNAAFKKTERKTSDNDSKKSTEWVLEEFAIRDGVQSTTRYRNPKGTGTKKFVRNETPSLARVVSGRRGGISTKQAKLQQQRQQRVKDDRRDPARLSQRADSMNVRRSQFQQQTRSQISPRQRSPLTPPSAADSHTSPSPYFFPVAKFDQSDPYDEVYRMGDVRGVCIEDGPVFSDGLEAHFPGAGLMSNRHY